ncbi:PadR family transcriptional regulator [Streptacidiphilus rugosus]|uniref:PadR family transcriptional regulator n=1 Tax=Streptacidiphilus rugosus TaxID=405783 RepID=UPI00055A8635|nr:PadR family transcriptional regulator [Streptacidiphilus rugosus]
MSSDPALTTTSYAILGLLSVRAWSTYELAQQMDRSLGRIWPRARSKIYEEPKKLVRLGLARAERQLVGRRPRTVYAITEEGRERLVAWLHEPGEGPVLECEQLLQVFFAESASPAATLATLRAARAWAVERNQGNLAAARDYQSGAGPFPERAAQLLLVGRFLTDYYRLVAEWAGWAADVVAQWPEELRDATVDAEQFAETVRRADWNPD